MLRKGIISIFILVITFNFTVNGNIKNEQVKRGTIVNKTAFYNHKNSKVLQSMIKIKKSDYFKSNAKIKCNIKYPEITGLSDNKKEKKINYILKNEAIKVLKYYKDSSYFTELNIDYKVVLNNENILSIQYFGQGLGKGAVHSNNLFYTTNINVKNGNRFRLKDIINIDKDFANKFLKGTFKALWPQQREALSNLSNKQVRSAFEEADSLDNIGTKKQSDVFSYFTKNSLGISISASHSIGDHAEFEVKYKDIKDNMNTRNSIWKYLFSIKNLAIKNILLFIND